MTSELDTSISWTTNIEEYFKKTGERSYALSILHNKSEALYSKRRTFIDLPVIVLSGIIGFLNAGSSTIFHDQVISSVLLGLGSLSVGVMNTLGTYFSWSKRAEGHRISAIQYSRLFRFLSIELSLPREERMTPHDLLKYTKDNYDRLQEISPPIPNEVIEKAKIQFNKDEYKGIAKPSELNGLEPINIFTENSNNRLIIRNVSSTTTLSPNV